MAATPSFKAEFVDDRTFYGKSGIKVLRFHREGAVHYIREFEVSVNLSLSSKKDYETGDNSDIIATDTQKNTVYALAKMKGIRSVEQFGQDLCQHFLDTYHHVLRVQVHIEEAPWQRIQQEGKDHNHAFVITHQATRFADVIQEKYRPPTVTGGLKNMKVLKTTQSGFVGFVRDQFTSLPETKDRVFSTIVACNWKFSSTQGVDYDHVWNTVKGTILSVFAGPPDSGVYSASVQHTLHIAEKQILELVPQIDRVEMEMPNVHYFLADLAKIGMQNNNEVYAPTDKPYGVIHGTIQRPHKSKL